MPRQKDQEIKTHRDLLESLATLCDAWAEYHADRTDDPSTVDAETASQEAYEHMAGELRALLGSEETRGTTALTLEIERRIAEVPHVTDDDEYDEEE